MKLVCSVKKDYPKSFRQVYLLSDYLNRGYFVIPTLIFSNFYATSRFVNLDHEIKTAVIDYLIEHLTDLRVMEY